MEVIAQNRPRFSVPSDHVESWFLRANDPLAPRAVWLKATVLLKRDGTSLAQAWISVFDEDRTLAICQDVPLGDASFDADAGGEQFQVGGLQLQLDSDAGATNGSLESERGSVSWALTFDRHGGSLGRPMLLLPSEKLIDAGFPKNKLLTPFPLALFSGSLTWNDETWDLSSWHGMQGHNWGTAHSPEYAWGQCVFTEAGSTAPVAVVEAASGRIELGPRQSPLMSMMVVRHGDQEYRFDRILDLWRQKPRLEFPEWHLQMRGSQGTAVLSMTGSTSRMVCLNYQNPQRSPSYCLNSKTSPVSLTVSPRKGPALELSSPHGGALEFLRPEQSPDVQPVV
jgi:hypothetical protein